MRMEGGGVEGFDGFGKGGWEDEVVRYFIVVFFLITLFSGNM